MTFHEFYICGAFAGFAAGLHYTKPGWVSVPVVIAAAAFWPIFLGSAVGTILKSTERRP